MKPIKGAIVWILLTVLALGCTAQPMISPSFEGVERTSTTAQIMTPLPTVWQFTAPATFVEPLETNCVSVLSEPPLEQNLPGSLMIGRDRFDVNSTSFLETINPEARYLLLSPDGKWVSAVVEIEHHAKYDIVTRPVNAAEPEYHFLYNGGHFITVKWVNNQTLLLRIYNPMVEGGFELVLVSPFTNQYQPILTTYPGLEENENVEIELSPDLNRLVYVAYENNPNTPWFLSQILWDLETNEPVTVLGQASTGHVRWSPNGKYLVFNEMEIRDAERFPLRLVVVNAFGEEIVSYEDPDSIVDYAWSPDSRKIGFKYQEHVAQSDDHFLGVWNIETGEVIKSCLPVDACGQLVWSPDSRYLASGSGNKCIRFPGDDEKEHVLFWNLEQQWAIEKTFQNLVDLEWLP